MNLEAGVTSFEHDRVVLEVEFVGTLDLHPIHPAAHPVDGDVQGLVTLPGRHVLQTEIRFRQRGQDAGQHHLGAVLVGLGLHLAQHVVQRGVHLGKALPAEGERREIDLEVEQGDLGGELRSQVRQDLVGNGSRPPAAVDQEHLLLGADAPHARLDAAVADHLIERAQIRQQRLGEGTELRGVLVRGDVLTTHSTCRGLYRIL